MSTPIKVKRFQMWNMSITMLFGKTPKCEMVCGKCNHYFSRRFSPQDFRYGYKGYPVAMCPKCHTTNYIPVKVTN